MITAELNKAVDRLLKTLLAWQEREKHANPLHAASHKRVLSGLRWVPQCLTLTPYRWHGRHGLSACLALLAQTRLMHMEPPVALQGV